LKRDRNPKFKTEPRPTKHPKIAEDPNEFLQRHPAWRVSQMEFCDPFGWHSLDAETISFVHNKLAQFESMTWNEIIVQAKKQNHMIETHKLCKEARERLEELGLDDAAELLSLRLSGRERVWGMLRQGILVVLWWDPEHQVCPSMLKNT
jgi:hypothetical protein